jgi:type I restriction enzyme S subunit
MAQGAAQQNISKEKVAKTFVAVPPPEVVAQFAESVGPFRASSHVLYAENIALATTRDLLLPRLVTGRLDISDVDLGALLSEEIAA